MALCLSRKERERIILKIGDVQMAIIEILEIDRNRVRLSIQAPHEVVIDREEVSQRRAEFSEMPTPLPVLSERHEQNAANAIQGQRLDVIEEAELLERTGE